MEIGAILAEARKAAGLLQKDVADAMGISVQYLSDIERGRCAFPVSRVPDLPPPLREKMAAALVALYHQQADELTKWLPKIS